MSDITSIRNVGPAAAEAFGRAGIISAEEVRNLGAVEAYRRLVASGAAPHFIGFYALAMGLQGRPWNDCQGAEKDALRQEFDAIKRSAKASEPSGIDKLLDEIGVVPARKSRR